MSDAAGTQEQTHAGSEEGTGGREQHWVSGDKIISTVRDLIREGNVRHVVIKNEEGRTLIEFPVTLGVAGALLAPVWAAVGAIAALVTKCSIEVEREPAADEDGEEDEAS